MIAPTSPGSPAGSSLAYYRDEYVTLHVEPDGLIIRMVRSPLRHPSPRAMEQSYVGVIAALDGIGRAGRGLLVDMRETMGRNEPEYEPVLRRARTRIDQGFLRVAVLLRTTIGLLQMRRFAEDEGILRLLSMDEAEVIAYLRHGEPPRGTKPPASKMP